MLLPRPLTLPRYLCATRLKPSRSVARPFALSFIRLYSPTMAPKAKKDEGSGRPLEMTPPPEYFATRNAIFDKRKAEREEWVAKQPREDIEITLASGAVKQGKSWETTPAAIAREISKSLFERTVIAQVDGDLWDLERPFEKSCKLELLDFEHPEGKKVFWHSSAHILGEACERHYGCSLCIGPPVEDGFYYEMSLPEQGAVTAADYKPLKQVAEKAIKEKQPFERLELTKEDLLEMFAYNKYKQHIISDKIPDGTSTTVYRCGPLIDLCRGPHVPHTGRIKAFEIMKNSSSYFLGDAKNDSLQRIYGVSFPDKAVGSFRAQILSLISLTSSRPSPNTSTCSRRRPSATIARLVRSRSFSSSTRCLPAPLSSSLTA